MFDVIDFGGQYTQLIRRALNEQSVNARIVDAVHFDPQKPENVDGVILSGGPGSVNEDDLLLLEKVLEWKLPALGICYGHQLLAVKHGGTVRHQTSREYGAASCRITPGTNLTRDLAAREYPVWMSHGDTVTAAPTAPGWRTLGITREGNHAIIAHDGNRLYGVQFHPEVTQTECGPKILENFIRICGSPKDFQPQDLVTQASNLIRTSVGTGDHVLVGASLGVDSTTAAVLCANVLSPERVHTVSVNNGLLRTEDLELAQRAKEVLPDFHFEDREDEFLDALEGIADPQEKRRVIGEHFWKAFRDISLDLRSRYPLAAFIQGTLAPDVIESGASSHQAAVIKTHHNLVPPPPDFPLPILEPLRSLYKDQVRVIGEQIGTPLLSLHRHPFPGPGLAIRVCGPVTRERIRVVRACDDIFIGALHKHKYYDKISQAFAVLGSDMAVCVRGDAHARGWPVTLRAYWTRDFMTAKTADLPHSFLTEVSDLITNTVPEIACVSYNYTSKPPATIEWE